MNAYPELPIIPYEKTQVNLNDVVSFLSTHQCSLDVKRACYVIFRNESANGLKGINNNYAGVQADSGRWPDLLTKYIIGVVQLKENRTGKTRLFCAFSSFEASVLFLIDRIEKRGLYIGGICNKIVHMPINNVNDLAAAYYKSWVTGEASYNPTEEETASFKSMYTQAERLLS